jgi:hypothetical protein
MAAAAYNLKKMTDFKAVKNAVNNAKNAVANAKPAVMGKLLSLYGFILFCSFGYQKNSLSRT